MDVTKYKENLNGNSSKQLKLEIKKTINLLGDEIRGEFLDKNKLETLQKEIEANYVDGNVEEHFRREKDDIRIKLFNYDNPIAEKTVNGVNLRIAEGLIRNKEKTYLLYADGSMVGEFYVISDIKKIIKYIEDNLINVFRLINK
ncbi:hypothetical protein [Flavicella sp.]|uniref:hypothetical protein n=1 Tax=Flavicella sp. TaxID=2957742 RepID=UPI00260C51F2|nr:hypothetical protein [Flavicella sp.]MDG1805922.1 hypothetical protein [Flavicella sp.]